MHRVAYNLKQGHVKRVAVDGPEHYISRRVREGPARDIALEKLQAVI
jgi:hypothetical protein